MTLLEISADLKETNRLLARLCEAVEYAAGLRPIVRPGPVKVTGLEDISRVTNSTTWEAEREREAERLNPQRRVEPEL
jgi:hypothetical protein